MKQMLIVDDHTMFRQAVIALVTERLTDVGVACDEAGSADAARQQLSGKRYDLVLLDISMPVTGGMELLPELRRLYPDTPVLMLSMYPEEQFALEALRLGATGYLTKQEAAEELLAAIQTVLEGGRYLSRAFSKLLVNQVLEQGAISGPPHLKLSRRELQILRQLAIGRKLKNIGDELGLSIKTVSTYKARLCAKMGFRNNADLLNYALQYKL